MEAIRTLLLEHGITFLIGLLIGSTCGMISVFMAMRGR
jgi:hypothetical protein